MDLGALLQLAASKRASDLHLTQNSPPVLRVDGELVFVNSPPLSREALKLLVYQALTEQQVKRFEAEKELDFSYWPKGLDRFRVNVHVQRGAVEAAFRRVPVAVPPLAELGLPPVVSELARRPNGLVLVTGPTGVGKSTTLAAMIELINAEQTKLVICIEDPVEFVHVNRKSVIKQREVHRDTSSFAEALKRCLRQDPDVIVVGEMRDLETISTALTAAETGHLVIATLHTPDAAQTIERVIDVFPPYQQQQVRLQLAGALRGVVSQQLVPLAAGKGRALAAEVMIGTPAVRNLIREKQTSQLPSIIQSSASAGMISMAKALKELCGRGLITVEAALAVAPDLDEFRALTGLGKGTGT